MLVFLQSLGCAGKVIEGPLASPCDFPQDLNETEIVVATTADYPPMLFHELQTGNLTGWEFHYIQEIGRILNANIQWVICSEEDLLQGVKDGRYHIAINGMDEQWLQNNSVTNLGIPYIVQEWNLLKRSNDMRFSSQREFIQNDSLTLGVTRDSKSFQAIENVFNQINQEDRLNIYSNRRKLKQALLNQQVDAICIDPIWSHRERMRFTNRGEFTTLSTGSFSGHRGDYSGPFLLHYFILRGDFEHRSAIENANCHLGFYGLGSRIHREFISE